ncbi:CHAP domain-containing protein [Sphaerisporangium melleum]|uniref:CHAP domain-containing protein n=1 Tax=Sphaerisporangium melleum TaxID=321316 RepID=UPI001E4CDFBB|nr:CHAP domain-containing protein [Sphaerisporangium melleum]
MADPIADGLLEAMRSELGYREKAGQHTKFGDWYAENIDRDPQYKNAPWCDMFIAWAADKAGVRDYVGTFAWTPSHANWFKAQNAWSETPEPGAIVFYDWSGSKKVGAIDHVGVVEKVADDGKIHTIEGNVDKVWLKRKVRDESKVVGYGLPRKVMENKTGSGPDVLVLRGEGTGGSNAAAAGVIGGHPVFEWPGAQSAALASGVVTLLLGSALVMNQMARTRRSAVSGGRHRRHRPRRLALWRGGDDA